MPSPPTPLLTGRDALTRLTAVFSRHTPTPWPPTSSIPPTPLSPAPLLLQRWWCPLRLCTFRRCRLRCARTFRWRRRTAGSRGAARSPARSGVGGKRNILPLLLGAHWVVGRQHFANPLQTLPPLNLTLLPPPRIAELLANVRRCTPHPTPCICFTTPPYPPLKTHPAAALRCWPAWGPSG